MKPSLRLLLLILIVSAIGGLFCVSSSAFSGEGTEASPYLIGTADDLEDLAAKINDESTSETFAGCYYILTADITAAEDHTPIGTADHPFRGVFDGDGHTVTMSSSASVLYRGLFGVINGGTVSRLSVMADNADGGKRSFGAIAGELCGGATVSQCVVSGSISGTSQIGGIVGTLEESSIVVDCLCTAQITVNGGTAGGLVGNFRGGTVLRSVFAGKGILTEAASGFGAIAAAVSSENAFASSVYYPSAFHAIFGSSDAFPGATALSEDEMHSMSSFGELSSSLWSIPVGEDHPDLLLTASHFHRYSVSVVAPTCTEDGYTLFTCTCGDTQRTNLVKAKGHTFAAYEILSEATCFNTGLKSGYCTTCEKDVTETIPTGPHTPKADPEIPKELIVAAKCDTDGSCVKIWRCSVCNAEVDRETVTIPARHKWEQTEVIAKATCLIDGQAKEECSACHKTRTVEIKAPGYHDYHTVTTEAKCLEDGKVEKICQACGDTVLVSVIPHPGHSYFVETLWEASCTECGKIRKTCTKCPDVVDEDIPVKGHNIPSYSVNRPATCEEKGEKTGFCVTCRETVTEYSDPLEHIPGEKHRENEIPATCSVKGSYDEVIRCTRCTDILSSMHYTTVFAEHIPSDLIRIEISPATCTSGSYYVERVICTVCHDVLFEEYKISEVFAHNVPHYEITTKPTCLSEGIRAGECTLCHTIVTESVPPTGHTPGKISYENEIPATCTKAGSIDEVNRCFTCQEEISRTPKVIPAKDHTPAEAVRENERKPSCTEPGSYDLVVYCGICTTELSRETKTVKPTGHHFSNPETVKEPTCVLAGEKRGYCSNCGAVTTEVIPPLDHLPAEAVEETIRKPTCTAPGTYDEVVICSRCKIELSRTNKETAPLGHTPAEPMRENEQKPSCTEPGSYELAVYCRICTAELSRETETVKPTGHHFSDPETVKEPTCVLAGEKRGFCSKCGQNTSEIIPPLDHLPAEAVEETIRKPTCTAPGTYDEVVICLRCKIELSRTNKETAPLGHRYETNVVLPTVEKGGYTLCVCSVCGDSYQTDFTDPIDPGERPDAAKIAAFRDAVNAAASVTADGELFAPTEDALKLYRALSDEEKRAVASDYETLLTVVDRYNAYADSVNSVAKEATHSALLSLIGQFTLIGLLWIYLRDFFFGR